MTHTPTIEQETIISAVASQPESLRLIAYAGCAKSSTLQMSAPGVTVPAIALAFNKSTARELDGKLPGNFAIKTINGLGHGALIRGLGLSRPNLDEQKLGKLVTQVAKDRKIALSSNQWDGLRRLVSRAMQEGLVPSSTDKDTPLAPDTPETWAGLAEDIDLDPDEFDFLRDMAHETLTRNNEATRLGQISFDDQVYGSVCLGGQFPKYPVVFVDEAQDLSPLNHAMLHKTLRPGGRLIACGDPRQAIYNFRGADSDSMNTMLGLASQWLDLPLTLTFRCPKTVVARQQFHAPGFSAFHLNPEGTVRELNKLNEDGEVAWTWAEFTGASPGPTASLAILCRNNSPLLGMAFRLLRAGVGVKMLGRDIGKGLEALSRKIAHEDSTPADKVRGAIAEWRNSETSLAVANGKEHKVSGIVDRAECLLAVLDSALVRDAGQLRQALAKLFARTDGLITLSSIHRAKGLEWDMVMLLDPWRMPSKFARQAAAAGDTRQLIQENNLRYVAETRTRHTLVLANYDSFEQGLA